MYTKMISTGENIVNKGCLRSDTVAAYLGEVNQLFLKSNLQKPIDLANRSLQTTILYKNIRAEENVAKQRRPLTNMTVAKILELGKRNTPNSKEALIADLIGFASQVGPRAAEIVQKTKKVVGIHTYPSGKTVIKAICADRVKFYDNNGREVKDPVKDYKRVKTMKLIWVIQKNRRNGEIITYVTNAENPDLCVVIATINMIRRARSLKQPENMPLCVYADKDGNMKYLTANELTQYIRKCTALAHPDMTAEELSYYSCHSFRVWACILLHQQGKSGDYIRVRLRWLSEAYRVYLRDTEESAKQHNRALTKDGDEISFRLHEALLLDDDLNHVSVDEEMGDYEDIE